MQALATCLLTYCAPCKLSFVFTSCSSVAALEAVHKSQLEGQQTIVVRFDALDKELVLVPVKIKTGTHRDRPRLVCLCAVHTFGDVACLGGVMLTWGMKACHDVMYLSSPPVSVQAVECVWGLTQDCCMWVSRVILFVLTTRFYVRSLWGWGVCWGVQNHHTHVRVAGSGWSNFVISALCMAILDW
jgi:hypothetical protein